MYIYPDNLKAKAVLWLWELRDIGIIGIGFIVPLVVTALYGFLSIRFSDTSILDFLRYACAFFLAKQQLFEWRYTAHE